MASVQQGSYWMESPGPSYPALEADITVDVAVVGAGIAGVCTAWELARRGRSVALLEAGAVLAGVTGHTTAKLSALHTLAYDRITRRHGPDAARRYAASQQDAVEHVVTVASDLGIDCELEMRPAFTYADTEPDGKREHHVEALRREVLAASRAGLAATFTTDTGLPFPVAGAVRVEGQAQFHPVKYLRGLLDDLVALGGQVFEHTRVDRLREGSPCQVGTRQGLTVTATDVVVTTHYPVFDRALLFARLAPRRELVVAGTIPADRDPHGMYITPQHGTRSVRTAPVAGDRRLLIVTGEHFTPGAGAVSDRFQRLTAWAMRHYPGVQLTHRWAAQDNSTTDGVPFVGRLHPGATHAYVATGFGGWGMSNGVMAGRLLASLVAGDPLPWAGLYDPRRFSPRREATSLASLQAHVARHFVLDRVTGASASPTDVAPGTGRVVRVGSRHCAVYRDDGGEVHALSARCTHLGCLVRFNDAERAWECPCHGSRFDIDGSVLHGPATAPLRREDLSGAS